VTRCLTWESKSDSRFLCVLINYGSRGETSPPFEDPGVPLKIEFVSRVAGHPATTLDDIVEEQRSIDKENS
jgi:hypothetical protein